ncbi:MAG: regulator [Microbacteriaceae bacterium]|nr:regulator [Microbacteriaceae bacterium]
MIIDDFDSRPGSATSLLRTIIGSYLRALGGWISIADLIRLLSAVEISPSHARTAVLRVKNKGLLLPETRLGVNGYLLNPDANRMLERGDRRIFEFRQQRDGGAWCLVSFSLPETERAKRHQLRKRLTAIGCGTVATGLWICPSFMIIGIEDILTELDLKSFATVFITDTPQVDGTLAEAIKKWWDLPELAKLHLGFLAEFEHFEETSDPEKAFKGYICTLDSWRVVRYLDPGLQARSLPEDWPGFASAALFDRIKWELSPAAAEFVFREPVNLGQGEHPGSNQSKHETDPLSEADSFS